MPMWPYENFDACVMDQKSKGESDESANKICGAIKAKMEASEQLSEASPKLAKRVIDALSKAGKDLEMINYVIYKLECMIIDEVLKAELDKASDEDIQGIINTIIEEQVAECYSEIKLSEAEFSEDTQYELITTAKQTDSRYWDFSYSKEQLETMAKNFNENIVGTEIPVDLNHDPEHIAYAWIKPGSMEVKKSSQLEGQYSLYAQLYKFTPEGKDMVSTGKVRYFSLQIQNTFTKFVDKTKKIYNLVIRALALTNMPVIKDMAPTFSESDLSTINHTKNMEKVEELQAQLSEKDTLLSEKDQSLAETTAENKRLSEELAKVNSEKLEKFLSDEVEKLCLSEENKVGIKGGEKEKVLAFVRTLSESQAKEYFSLHTGLFVSVDLGEHGEGDEPETVTDETAEKALHERGAALAKAEGIKLSDAYNRILSEDKELASKIRV